jgi:type II secretion system protein C
MSAEKSRYVALTNLAFAGVGAALLARGVIIIQAGAPTALDRAPVNEMVSSVRNRETSRAAAISAFPALARETPDAPVVTAAAEDVEEAGTGPLVPLAADVVGITYFSQPEWSLANMVVNNERNVYAVNACAVETRRPCNDLAPGYKLTAILRDRVRVLHEASRQTQEIMLDAEAAKKRPEIPVAAAMPATDTGASHGKGSPLSQALDKVKQTGPNSWEAPPGMREDVLGRLTEVAMEGRWMPFFEGGKIAGFKLAQTVANSAFDKIGLKSGDVIRSVNGYDISSPDKMLEVFNKLRDARNISVDIQRGDKGPKQTMQYTIN